MRPFVLIRSRGPAWDDSQPLEGQKEWTAHAALMDAMTAEGFIVLAGPLEGSRDVVLVVRGESREQILDRFAADPWVRDGLLVEKDCRPWLLRLGSLPEKG